MLRSPAVHTHAMAAVQPAVLALLGGQWHWVADLHVLYQPPLLGRLSAPRPCHPSPFRVLTLLPRPFHPFRGLMVAASGAEEDGPKPASRTFVVLRPRALVLCPWPEDAQGKMCFLLFSKFALGGSLQ